MKKTDSHIECLLSLAVLMIFLTGCDPPKPNPNVVIILTDDQGWADIGYNNPKVYTPNLDRLAKEGVVFTQHYVMPQCTPTRVALLTGRYPGRFGPQALQALRANDSFIIPHGTSTLAHLFKENSYNTYMVGKWHVGDTPENGPNHFGFDESYGFLTGAVGMYDHRYREGTYENTWHRNLQIISDSENGVHATDLITQEAIRIIEQDHQQPFFLYLAYNAVHTPLDERGPFVDQPTALNPDDSTRWINEQNIKWFNDPDGLIQSERDPEKRLLLAATYHLDHAIGEVISALEQSNQRDNTLILFSSDNGPQVDWPGNAYPDDLRLTDFNQPLPFRGRKTDVWEGGIHVPAFANWPGRIDAGTIDDPVHIVDWYPTFSSLLGTSISQESNFDGEDLYPIIFKSGSLAERELYWIWNRSTNKWALRIGDWKIVKNGVGEPSSSEDWHLYNLIDDPQEQLDVADQHPDLVSHLHERFVLQREKDVH